VTSVALPLQGKRSSAWTLSIEALKNVIQETAQRQPSDGATTWRAGDKLAALGERPDS
jgi:hypothetical protein